MLDETVRGQGCERSLNNEWTRCGALRNFRFRMRYNPKSIRRMVVLTAHRTKRLGLAELERQP